MRKGDEIRMGVDACVPSIPGVVLQLMKIYLHNIEDRVVNLTTDNFCIGIISLFMLCL